MTSTSTPTATSTPHRLARAAGTYLPLTLILSAAALANGFPLVYPDTASYVGSARWLEPPADRPIAYGLFVRAVTLDREPFLAIAAQALLVGWLLVAALRHGAGVAAPRRAAVGVAVALALTTGLSVAVSHLLPDVLAPVAILAVALIVATRASAGAKVAAAAAIAVAAAAHPSVLVIVGLVCAAVLARRTARRGLRAALRGPPARRVALAAAAACAGALGLASLNAALGGRFELVPGTPVFLVGRMAQTGLLQDVLAARCPAAGWRLCAHRAELRPSTDWFLWGAGTPLRDAGGFAPQGIAECRAILRASLSEPRFVLRHLSGAARGAAEQLGLFDLRWVNEREGTGGWVRDVLVQEWPGRAAALDASRQRRGVMRAVTRPVEQAQLAVVGAGAFAAVALLAGGRGRSPRARAFAALLLAGVVANAVACGALSAPDGRYGARVAFLVPLAVAVVLLAPHRRAAA